MEQAIAYSFGRVLRQLRQSAGITQETLGLEAGLQRKYISSLELGEYQPTLATVFKLALALKIEPAKLVEMVEIDVSNHARVKD